MATKIIKICDICGKEYREKDRERVMYYGTPLKEPICVFNGELQLRYSTNDPILGDNTVKMFNYDLCPECTSHYINKLKILYPEH